MTTIDHVSDQLFGLGNFVLKSVFVIGPALDTIKNNRPWTNNKPWAYGLGAYTFLGSVALLVHFYQTRRFVIEGKVNYSDVAKFAAAAAWLTYCNVRYFNP